MEFFLEYHKHIEETGNSANKLPGELIPINSGFQIESVYSPTASAKQDTLQTQKDSVPSQPTIAQIRYWRWIREKKLLIGDSRYIQSKKNVRLNTSIKAEDVRLGLPNHKINRVNTDWITILFLIITILFATVRVMYSKYMAGLFQSLVNYSTSFRMFREKNYTILHGAYRLDIIFYLTFSFFLCQVLDFFQFEYTQNKVGLYFASLGMVFTYFFVKKIVYRVIGSIFESIYETNEYLFNVENFNRTLGLTLFPVIALINYYPIHNPTFIVFTGLFMAAIFYIFLVLRGISILLRKQFSIFYLFLYLCTLEIIPLILIYKVVVL